MGSETNMNETADSSQKPAAAAKGPEGLAARRAKLENTKAYRDLQVELANKVCEHCGQKGPWEVISSPKQPEGEKKVRFLRCFACGHQTKMASDN